VTWLVAQLFAWLLDGKTAECPRATWINGIRADGRFECYRTSGRVEDVNPPSFVVVRGRIYCAADEVPIVVDERRAACRQTRVLRRQERM
jgi:hypothetical protein